MVGELFRPHGLQIPESCMRNPFGSPEIASASLRTGWYRIVSGTASVQILTPTY